MIRKSAVALVAAIAIAGLSACGARERLGPQQVVEQASPAVVSITGKFGELDAGGSGVVFDARRGLVLTNAHVVSALSALKAKVGDQPTVPVRVLGRAPCDDLAVLEMVRKPAGLKELPFGDSSSTKRGEHVTALGYPTNFDKPEQQTLTSTDGRVSNPSVRGQSLDPTLPEFPFLIQHQAPLNLGNSGGALVNDLGELVGINTVKVLGTEEMPAEGQGFAIPIDQVKTLVDGLIEGDSFDYVGWNFLPTENVDISDQFKIAGALGGDVGRRAERRAKKRKLDQEGLYNVFSDEPSPALKAGVVAGDVVTTIDATPVADFAEVCGVVQSKAPGDRLSVGVTQFDSARKEKDIFRSGELEVTLKK